MYVYIYIYKPVKSEPPTPTRGPDSQFRDIQQLFINSY